MQATVIINLIDVNDNPPELNSFQVVFNNYRTDKPYAFPIGPIGKVPAHDADVTSVLKYRYSTLVLKFWQWFCNDHIFSQFRARK